MDWRERTAVGALTTALALGLQEAVGGRREDPPIVEEAPGEPTERPRIEPWLVPDRPEASWVVVRYAS